MTETSTRRLPAINFDAAGGVDPSRLERSLGLAAERTGDGRYRVTGGREVHWVDLHTASHPRCDCGDHLWREAICKHILAALLREGNPRVIGAVGHLVSVLRHSVAAA
ncbi:MAG TPA: SWIM zinc finger family protein [Gemmatimonadaceae bacterium]|nr:SWIM zinc finger family protein [Gemmatimonadaceae bacterium]